MERRLTALHPALVSLYDNPSSTWATPGAWEQISPTVLVHETSLDLSGYSRDRLTFFPEAIGLQDPGVYSFAVGPGATYSGLQVLDIITSVPLDISATSAAQITDNVGPGMIDSLVNFETLIFGMYRFFTQNSNLPYPNYQQLERSQRFDSGEPNASDRLYCYRIVTCVTNDLGDGSLIGIPAARQLIGGQMEEESELVYMQRLKRSYELKQ